MSSSKSEGDKTSQRHSTRMPKHNYRLYESLFISFTFFLILGLGMIATFKYFEVYLRLPKHSSSSSLKSNEWEHVHNHGDIVITKKTEVDRPFNTFRFEHETDLPFESLMDVLLANDQVSLEWFAWEPQQEKETIVKKDDTTESKLATTTQKKQEHHHRDPTTICMTIPYLHLTDREFDLHTSNELITKAGEYEDEQDQIAKFRFRTSIPTELYGTLATSSVTGGDCKKGELDMHLTLKTTLTHQQKGDDRAPEAHKTHIELKSYMDLHSSRIPNFVMNNLSMRWGSTTLLKLECLCRTNLGYDNVGDLKSALYNLFPIKR